jgi:hypothetical protein
MSDTFWLLPAIFRKKESYTYITTSFKTFGQTLETTDMFGYQPHAATATPNLGLV